eukprot:g31363.t1
MLWSQSEVLRSNVFLAFTSAAFRNNHYVFKALTGNKAGDNLISAVAMLKSSNLAEAKAYETARRTLWLLSREITAKGSLALASTRLTCRCLW